jgi:hypothetical protein
MYRYRLFIILGVIGFAIYFAGCRKDEYYLKADRKFYDFPKNKLWAHRVNSASLANKLHGEFNGIEVDVNFINDINEFQTGHDSPSGVSLDSFLDSIQNCSSYYFWFDFKNLDANNVQNSVTAMKSIVNKFQLQGHVIVESSEPELLSNFWCHEIFTSYWISDLHVAIPFFAAEKLAKTVRSQVEQYHIDVLSCSYDMNFFFKYFFKNYNVHLWTNGLTGKSGMEKIRKLSDFKNVKVILVDYDKNFLLNHHLRY